MTASEAWEGKGKKKPNSRQRRKPSKCKRALCMSASASAVLRGGFSRRVPSIRALALAGTGRRRQLQQVKRGAERREDAPGTTGVIIHSAQKNGQSCH